MNIISSTATVALVAALGYGALNHFAPGLGAEIRANLDDVAGWNGRACQADPAGCIQAKQLALDGQIHKVADAVRTLAQARQSVAEQLAGQQLLQAKNRVYLEQGQALYQRQLSGPDTPVLFAGAEYPSLAVFKAQLQVLFQEQTALEAAVDSARAMDAELGNKLDRLQVLKGRLTQEQALLPAKLALFQANAALGQVEESIRAIDGLVADSERSVEAATSPIRNTAVLMESEPHVPVTPSPDPAFEAFLKGEGRDDRA